ncbi:MAG: adenylate/guanylate cyclase domain-containing protein [bacterium]|nr:adenylate/guanylate cyclase domain-containing protein [bacterium]
MGRLRPALLIGLGAAALAAALWSAGVLGAWERAAWSWRVRAAAAPSAATPTVKLILLDQASLDWGSRENGWSWPWPREVYAPILDFCARGGARTVAFDVLFTEPSVYGVEDDAALGAAMARAPGFVGAIFLAQGDGTGTGGGADQAGKVDQAGWGPGDADWACAGLDDPATAPLRRALAAGGATVPVAEAAPVSGTLANVADTPDPDGVYRRARPLRLLDGRPVPSLGLAAYLLGEGRGAALKLEPGRLLVGERAVPLDADGRALLRFAGPADVHETFSAAAIIQSELRLLEGGEPVVDPESLRGCDVLFGFSAPGLLDLRPMPLSRVAPGVALHAAVLDDLRGDGFLRDAPAAAVWPAIALLAVGAAALVLAGRKAWHGLLVIAATSPLPPLLGVGGYALGWWFPVVPAGVAAAGALAGGLVWNYATEGRQRRFLKQAFRHYLSPHVVERLIADPGQLRLGGERRELTIMFSDLAGFTSISEALDPVALTELLNDFLTDMTDIVLEEGGTLDKYEGDAIIAFWNAPLEVPDHAARACHAAWRCQQRLAARREEFRARTGHALHMRVGLHTGPVVVGNMGSRQRFNYTVLGDAANLASRLEGANKAFGTATMISGVTRAAAGATIAVRDLGAVRVVGRREPVAVFELLGPATAADVHAFDGYHAALALCRAGDAAAAAAFAALPDDPVARQYAERCRESAAGGEPFDGVWNLTSK